MSHTFEKADMGYTTGYYDGVAAGKKQAEARIIKLLEQASEDFEHYDFNAVATTNALIELIKEGKK